MCVRACVYVCARVGACCYEPSREPEAGSMLLPGSGGEHENPALSWQVSHPQLCPSVLCGFDYGLSRRSQQADI